MEIAVIGCGYVGLVAGAHFAEHGNDVICVDIDEKRVGMLNSGECPIYEPGLTELLRRNLESGRLKFTTKLPEAVQASSIIFIAVGTPQDEDGSADLSHVLTVAKGIAQSMNGPKIVVNKSTVPVGTAKKVRETIEAITKHPIEVVSNPEFLKEGAAIEDFSKPDRIVIGTRSEKAAAVMKELYSPFLRTINRMLVMDVESAELTKYAANTMLAVRISFMNEIANLCEKVGANVDQVRVGIGTDQRIGTSFLFPGLGYGGSCFPKDVQALIRTAHDFDIDLKLARATEDVNVAQKKRLIDIITGFYKSRNLTGKTFALWGLAFKAKTDDVREAPALMLCKDLIELGAKIVAYDAEAMKNFERTIGTNPSINYVKHNYEALDGADALIICTDWNEFRNPNFPRIKKSLKQPVIFDGRNLYNLGEMNELGFTYFSIGRPAVM